MHAPGPGPVAYESPQAGDAATTTVPITGRDTGVEREIAHLGPSKHLCGDWNPHSLTSEPNHTQYYYLTWKVTFFKVKANPYQIWAVPYSYAS